MRLVALKHQNHLQPCQSLQTVLIDLHVAVTKVVDKKIFTNISYKVTRRTWKTSEILLSVVIIFVNKIKLKYVY